jgi:signal transduction histidine kinase
MPKVELYRAIVSTVEYALGAILLLFLIVVTAASLVGRSIARSIDELVRIARAMERGEKIAVPRTGLAETTLVAEQLVRASERILTANEVLEQRVREAVEETRLAHAALLDNQKLEALGRLTGGIAHDFNNLLQTINTSIEIGARASTDERVKSAMVLAGRAMQRATRVTRQLMTFARTAVSEQAVLDIRVAMKSLEELLAGALRRDIDTRIDLPADLGNIRVDPVQLELAVLNIALNARDAMPGSGLFAVSGRNEHLREQNVLGLPAGDYVVLSFEDSGCGIAPEALPRVFEPFYTTKDVGKGTGLGLAQVYGFAKQSGGAARVESERGRGTRVDLVVPRTARGATEQVDDRLRELPKVLQGQATVLLVEDDALIAEVMEPALKGAGFEVLTAATGAAGQEILHTRRVDIVFSDIVMPGGMSGTDLARYVEETHPGIPVVLATGYSDAVPRTSTMRILLKPYDLHSVVSALVDELRKRDANPAQPA